MFIKADILNGMINTVIMQIIIFALAYVIVDNILKPEKNKKPVIAIIIFCKYLIFNTLTTYLRNIGYNDKPYIYWLGIANVLVVFLYFSITKIVTRKKYVLVVEVLAMIMDCVGGLLIVLPYNLIVIYVMKSEPIFFGENFDIRLILIYLAYIIYAIGIVVLTDWLTKKYWQKFIRLSEKRKKFIWGFFIVDISIGTAGYMIDSLFYDWHIFVYYFSTFTFGILIMYEASLYVRRKLAREVERENYALNIENAVMREYYETLSTQVEMNRKFRHDIDKHMVAIKSMIDENVSKEEMADYASEIKEEYEKIGKLEYCDNPVVNAVIQNKNKQCRQLGIQFDIQIKKFDIGKIKETDFIALMANILDNAIEECERISVQNKIINLKMGSLQNKLFIKVENSTDKSPGILQNLTTSKEDKESHGVGMKIIKDIVKKYGGEYVVKIEDGMFKTMIEI